MQVLQLVMQSAELVQEWAVQMNMIIRLCDAECRAGARVGNSSQH